MNSKSVASIYQLSRRAEEEEYEREAKSIVNAYRKVEQLPARGREGKKEEKKKDEGKEGGKAGGQSAYAVKVKEALKQINASKAKQLEQLSKCLPQRPEPLSVSKPACKLQRAAVLKVLQVLEEQEKRMQAFTLQHLQQWWEGEEQREMDFLRKWRLLRWLKAWRKEVVNSRAERHQQAIIQRQSLELAAEFRAFALLKKTLRGWQQEAKREARRRQHENLLVAQQITSQETEKREKTRAVQENNALQQKVRGFLDGLKQKVTQNDRLRTIKEKTEESRPNEEPSEDTSSNQPIQKAGETMAQQEAEAEGEEVGVQQERRQMAGDDLERRRKQLEAKHKSRREALEKLRQDKEVRRREEEAQRMEVERQLETEQKRIKQERYKQYLKNKNEEAAWQQREKELTLLADQFNLTRLQRYYGFLPWASVQARSRQKIDFLYQTILLILFRLRATQLMANMTEISSMKIEKQMQSMDARYGRTLLRKGLRAIKQNSLAEGEAKERYEVMHNVNTLKIAFTAWRRIRSELASQNYEWLKPRIKRAQQYYSMQLKHKAFKSLDVNKELRKKEACIQQQKKIIKSKIEILLKQNQSIDYQQYL